MLDMRTSHPSHTCFVALKSNLGRAKNPFCTSTNHNSDTLRQTRIPAIPAMRIQATSQISQEESSLPRRSLLAAGAALPFLTSPPRSKAEDHRVTEKVYLDLTLDGEAAGRVVIGLYGDEVPKTAMNFSALATGEKGYGYRGSKFHRVVKGFVLQGGDFEKGNGTGGRSIYGKSFDDENFDIKHFPFAVSMANAGPNTNGSQFFITLDNTPWLDGKHTVFGEVVSGRELVDKLQNTPVNFFSAPKKSLVIANCGVVK